MISETETDTREKRDPVVIEQDSDTENDDFKRLLFDLWLEQTEQMG